ncbi:hypothetical protein D3C71_1258620 [compost metagenome]
MKKSPTGPLRAASDWPTPPRLPPIVNTPDRLRPTVNIRYTSAAMNHGCCSWKPQPAAWPAARSASTSAPIAANATSTPAVYQSAWLRARCRLSPLCATPSTFSDRIGSTHGIRLRISPPSSASSSAPISVVAAASSPGGRVRWALSALASVATRASTATAAGSLGRISIGCVARPAASRSRACARLSLPGSGAITSFLCATSSALALILPAGSDSFTRRVIGG